MNEVTVTILPHPITMFILGGMLLGLILLFLEYRRTRQMINDLNNQFESQKQMISSIKEITEKSIQEVSRKVDSRIDKALGNVKKG
jgi:predicted histidine transporter YuiF (NhaC family)